MEDANRNGWVGSNETSPLLSDTDRDGACDGLCSGKGEDVNLNGLRDKNADGNWTETDPLANDSDVDGILDGAEIWGTWCNATELASQCTGAANSSRVLDPLNADTDGDQLRDGQEIAGWRVLVWREGTMEVLANYTVASNPLVQDSEGDGSARFAQGSAGFKPGRHRSPGGAWLQGVQGGT